MTLWILTIGNSDILLNTDSNWQTLRRRAGNPNLNVFKPVLERDRKSYSVPARSLGLVYQEQPESTDLSFARIDTLCQKFDQSPPPDQLIILLTDQSALFENVRNEHSPYWQDTCELRSLLTPYFERKFPGVAQNYWTIQPAPQQPGLDHWENTLSLIQSLFHQNTSMLEIDEQQQVYLSHQAGTPALSAAIQFVCLTHFGSRVHFLLSNEYQVRSYESIESKVYLKGLRKQEAKALLKQYDYAGVKRLFSAYLDPFSDNLLDAAILWNYAEFEEFAKILKKSGDRDFRQSVEERVHKENWWWTAYEAAYLSKVRLEQNDIVEAMFHSFRALEGLAIQFAERQGKKKIYGRKAFKNLRHHKAGEWNIHLISNLILLDLDDQELRNDILDRRNALFHRLSGLIEQALYDAWKTTNQEGWEKSILQCLNFISGRSDFESLEQVSLMAKVHAELERAIANSTP
jgi:hypothetical protein